jgi:hypothetical protein
MVCGSSSASAGAPTGTITVEPTSGSPGQVFKLSGEGCVSENGPGVMDVSAFFGGELIFNPDPAFVIPDEDGNWGVGLQAGGSSPTPPTQPESGT